ncbi:hypothetical protein E2C01_041354 [Portunus trituberculatus]|uniref:Uncharacterized protein n=1 Tax=Portunus trituberculatus TaxID=210409 RepID=A0A5B7FTC7_PORTR|nr:hypothetical protein [Portunus trituberculatus]
MAYQASVKQCTLTASPKPCTCSAALLLSTLDDHSYTGQLQGTEACTTTDGEGGWQEVSSQRDVGEPRDHRLNRRNKLCQPLGVNVKLHVMLTFPHLTAQALLCHRSHTIPITITPSSHHHHHHHINSTHSQD